MGLTHKSTGLNSADSPLVINKSDKSERIIALAGNPNVGKSTIFNALTGMKQHTGNWPGKTVSNAQGRFSTDKRSYILVDIPGTYSLMARSAEEEVARSFLCFGQSDAVVVVCDATCLERNLNLVLQTLEITENVIVCVNLLDEARRKGIEIDLDILSSLLGVPVVGTSAKDKKSLCALKNALDGFFENESKGSVFAVKYTSPIENALKLIEPAVYKKAGGRINPRWLSLKALDCDKSLKSELAGFFGEDITADGEVKSAVKKAYELLEEAQINRENLNDKVVACIMLCAEDICNECIKSRGCSYSKADRKIDKILTSPLTGYPIMLLLLALVLWITISGANYPSAVLSDGLFYIQDRLWEWYQTLNAPLWLGSMLILGVYRVTAWVISVMLPPMAIFFPLFTLLEDVGFLPRIAYNLDKPFKRCSACGKQALTVCMGFGCNAAGVVGCRIIDSPRERLIAVLTNSFVPCNGRFPALIAIITMFFIGADSGSGGLLAALILTLVIVVCIAMTFLMSKLLSKTFLKGEPSSFTLELPPFRKPQIGKVIVRSLFDRTLFVLARAVSVAAPAGLIIWAAANIHIGGGTVLSVCADFLDPFARLLGLDGVILIAFILGFPANETVIPIIIMAYMSQGSLNELAGLTQMRELFISNGWTVQTAVCMLIFFVFHWPCSTTMLTIKKETNSLKWTLLAFLLPTLCGIILCMLCSVGFKLAAFI